MADIHKNFAAGFLLIYSQKGNFMRLSELFSKLNIDERFDFEINRIETNTKNADDKCLFVAIKGTHVDTHEQKYIDEAYQRGTRAFILEHEVNLPEDSVSFIVEDTRKTLGLVSSGFFKHPSKDLRVIGVTGTKGKTSVSFIMKELIEKYGYSCGVIGTSGIFYNGKHFETKNTTPDPFTLQKHLRQAYSEGVKYMIIEVSSQAMKQFRVFGTRFMLSIFTNLSPDHIGPTEHADFDEYRKCKRNFMLLAKKAILNKDDENYGYMIEKMKSPYVSVGHKDADFLIENETEYEFDLNNHHIKTNLHGSFNKMNLSLALASLNEIGFAMGKLETLTDNLKIPGRMEVIDWADRKIVIDYAHNKLSLESLLSEIKNWKHNRILLAVGSVGGRTLERRHEIPEVANKYVDRVYFTADNPDFEDPNRIIDEMVLHSKIDTKKITDRATAIKEMLDSSEAGDIIIISGKGDEEHQLINGEKVPYSDKKVVLDYINK